MGKKNKKHDEVDILALMDNPEALQKYMQSISGGEERDGRRMPSEYDNDEIYQQDRSQDPVRDVINKATRQYQEERQTPHQVGNRIGAPSGERKPQAAYKKKISLRLVEKRAGAYVFSMRFPDSSIITVPYVIAEDFDTSFLQTEYRMDTILFIATELARLITVYGMPTVIVDTEALPIILNQNGISEYNEYAALFIRSQVDETIYGYPEWLSTRNAFYDIMKSMSDVNIISFVTSFLATIPFSYAPYARRGQCVNIALDVMGEQDDAEFFEQIRQFTMTHDRDSIYKLTVEDADYMVDTIITDLSDLMGFSDMGSGEDDGSGYDGEDGDYSGEYDEPARGEAVAEEGFPGEYGDGSMDAETEQELSGNSESDAVPADSWDPNQTGVFRPKSKNAEVTADQRVSEDGLGNNDKIPQSGVRDGENERRGGGTDGGNVEKSERNDETFRDPDGDGGVRLGDFLPPEIKQQIEAEKETQETEERVSDSGSDRKEGKEETQEGEEDQSMVVTVIRG